MIKNLIRCVSFLLVFLGILSCLSLLMIPKDNGSDSGIHDHKQHGILGEPPGSIDVLFIGDSLAQCGFSPLDIWEAQGITSHVCASGNQKLFLTMEYIEEVFRYHTPKVVVLEANPILIGCGSLEVLVHAFQKAVPALRYHDRWKTLSWSDFSPSIQYTHTDTLKGYHYESGAAAPSRMDYMVYSQDAHPIPRGNEHYVQEIAQFCASHGSRLVLVSAPSAYNWNYEKHNAIDALALTLGLTYWDMNLMPEVGIRWEEDTYDYGNHMNHSGARKASLFLGARLMETGLFQDKRPLPEYDSWHQALKQFQLDPLAA